MAALIDCLGRPDGCRVVPGLPPDQYFFTLWCAIAGGLVAGFVSKIEPQGETQELTCIASPVQAAFQRAMRTLMARFCTALCILISCLMFVTGRLNAPYYQACPIVW